ncbi:hypothetical protein CEXT_448941, partial [Caerostris extrusa]
SQWMEQPLLSCNVSWDGTWISVPLLPWVVPGKEKYRLRELLEQISLRNGLCL